MSQHLPPPDPAPAPDDDAWSRALNETAVFYDPQDRGDRKRSIADLIRLFHRFTAEIQPSVILEIGAREAEFAREARRRSPGARVLAFEASPHNYERFSDNARRDGVDYRHAAVSDDEGTVEFLLQSSRSGKAVSPHTGGNSLLARSLRDVSYEKVTVPSIRIDRLFEREDLAGPCAVWIDVEGSLAKVLPGLGGVLSTNDVVFCEVEVRRYWEDQWLVDDVLRFFGRHGMLPVARDYQHANQYNLVFAGLDARKALVDVHRDWVSSLRRQ